jgi:hypothetical protein
MKAASGVMGTALVYAGYKIQEANPHSGTMEIGPTAVNVYHQIPGVGPFLAAGASIYRIGHTVPGYSAGKAYEDSLSDMGQSIFGMPGIAVTVVGDIIKEGGVGGGVKRHVAQAVGTATNPLQPVTDLFSMIDAEQGKARDTSGHFTDPLLSHVPFANKTLPEQRSPERAGPIENSQSYLVGIRGSQTQTAAQNEIDRLGMKHLPWYPLEGQDASDKNLKYRTAAGDTFQKLADKTINSDEYKNADDTMKRIMLEKDQSAAFQLAKKTNAAPEDLISKRNQALMAR